MRTGAEVQAAARRRQNSKLKWKKINDEAKATMSQRNRGP